MKHADSGAASTVKEDPRHWPSVATWVRNSETPTLPRRIHIIGWAGSGKTHLARRLFGLIDAPVHELDLVAYGPTNRPGDTRRNVEERRALVQQIATERSWITEGIYLWWIDELLDAADLVVWLDLPRRISQRRILTRHFIASARRRNRYKGLRILWRFFSTTPAYYTGNRPPPTDATSDGSITRELTVPELREVTHKLVVCRRRSDVRSLVGEIRRRSGAAGKSPLP